MTKRTRAASTTVGAAHGAKLRFKWSWSWLGKLRFLTLAGFLWLIVRVVLPLIHVPIEEAVAITDLRRWLSVSELLLSELMLVFVATVCSTNAVELYQIFEKPVVSTTTRQLVSLLVALSVVDFGVGAVFAAILMRMPAGQRADPSHTMLVGVIGGIVALAITLTAFTDGLRARFRTST